MTAPLTFGGYQGDKSVHTRAARVLAEALGEAGIDMTLRQNIVEQGHKAADLLSLTESGDLDGCYFSSSYLASRVPELALFDQHFMVPTRAQAYGVLDGRLGERLAQEVEAKTGYKVLGYWDNGLRHISTARTPIRTPEDCAGLKLRTLKSDDHQRVFRALGFEPVAIDVRDLIAAVETGQVDAQENPLTNIYNFGLHQTHRYITRTGHLIGVALVLSNRARYEALSPDARAALRSAVARATAAQRRFAEEDDSICAQALQDDGVTLIDLTPDQRAAFAARVRPEVDRTRQRFGSDLIAMFEADLERPA